MANFFTLVVPNGTPSGRIELDGSFDRAWGFRFLQGPSGKMKLGPDGVGFRAGTGNPKFVIEIADMAGISCRVLLKWADPNNNNVSISSAGGMIYIDAANTDDEMIG